MEEFVLEKAEGKASVVRLPLTGTNFKFSFTLSVLGRVTFPVVIKLINFYQQEELRDLIKVKNITSIDELNRIVWEGEVSNLSLELSSAIAWIERLIINAESDKAGLHPELSLSPGESLQAYFYDLFESNRPKFIKLIEKLLIKDIKEKNAYTLFKPSVRLGIKLNQLNLITDIQLQTVKLECSAYFAKRSYGGWSGIYKYVTEDCVGFFIERAGFIKSSSQINSKDMPEETEGRRVFYDLVFYHIPSGAIWVNSKKKDEPFYAAMIQKTLFGEGTNLTKKIGMNFDFLSEENLSFKLNNYRTDEVELLTIHIAHFKSCGTEILDEKARSKKKGETCLSSPENQTFNLRRMVKGAIHKLEMAVTVKDQKAKLDIELTADKVKFSPGLSIEEVLGVVYKFNVIGSDIDV